MFVMLLLGCVQVSPRTSFGVFDPAGQVVKKPGVYNSPGGSCQVSLSISEFGGYLNLTVDSGNAQVVRDVTGVAWATENVLVYTVSPIYGQPGVYLFDCVSRQTTRIVAPSFFTKAYPNGSDYFELQGFAPDSRDTVYFYYAPDVDSIDFNRFRTIDFLFQVRLDGQDFKKVQE